MGKAYRTLYLLAYREEGLRSDVSLYRMNRQRYRHGIPAFFRNTGGSFAVRNLRRELDSAGLADVKNFYLGIITRI